MVITPRKIIHLFISLSCISGGWRTIIHFNSRMIFWKKNSKRILHPMVTWWFSWFEASSLRISTLPCQGAREEGLCRAMCPSNFQKYHAFVQNRGFFSSFHYQVIDLKMVDFPLSSWFTRWEGLILRWGELCHVFGICHVADAPTEVTKGRHEQVGNIGGSRP